MLSFEEFFLKKRIDLKQLQQARPELHEEFKTHYPLMGEKSFDHTKKYWFNRLRKEYQLSDEDAARMTKPTKPKTAGEVAPPGSSTSKPEGFTPRFKAKVAPPVQAPPLGETAAKTPSGFKPRFKAGASSPAKSADAPKPGSAPLEGDEAKGETAKPLGFKPRFRSVAKSKQQPPDDEGKDGGA